MKPCVRIAPNRTSNKIPSAFYLIIPLLSWSSNQCLAKEDMDVTGRVMLDYSQFDGIHNDDKSGSDWYVRRARMGIKHDSGRAWQASVEFDFDEKKDEVAVLEAVFEYQLASSTTLYFGKFKESFGLENTTSSNDISTLERSTATEIFSPGRNFGVAIEYATERFYNNFGVFRSAQDEEDQSLYAYTLRSVVNPVKNDRWIAHLGISATQRDMSGQWYEINEPMEIPVGDKFLESPTYLIENLQAVAFESALVYKRFSFQSEYFQQTLEPELQSDVEYDGYYVALGLFLSNHMRTYKNGSFDGFKPRNTESGVEIVGRYGEVTLLDDGDGMIAESLSLTLNYYLDKNVHFVLHAAKVETDSSNPKDIGDGNSATFRVVYKF